jgi:hypothetical protein
LGDEDEIADEAESDRCSRDSAVDWQQEILCDYLH